MAIRLANLPVARYGFAVIDAKISNTGRSIAVLTGDLVGSREMSADRIAVVRARLADVARIIDGWLPGLVIGGPQFFRGDSWQLALSRPGFFLRVAIGVRAAFKATDLAVETRIGIGIGPFERIDSSEVALSVGDAFVLSGGALDAMRSTLGCRVALAPVYAAKAPLISAITSLSDTLVNRFKPAQAESVWLSLDPAKPTQDEVAAQRGGIRKQTVSDALLAAGFPALWDAAMAIEGHDWSLIDR